MCNRLDRRFRLLACLFCLLLATVPAFAPAEPVASGARSAPVRIAPLAYEAEALDNGLRVLYARMDNAPVVHVRLLYHVGSRDERPDRQGFAHMFEHMMFRGSRHVPDDGHGKLIGVVGGDSNAFTSFDQTTYVNTVPSNQLELVLWLEADRMASYKVNREVFSAERNVVAEEWRLRTANPPYGSLFQDLFRTVFQSHTYRWTPIGDMDQLRQSSVAELQEFWNTYYVPNNACLVIAGQFDANEAKQLVRKYFAWIPSGADVQRNIPPEPTQTEPRRLEVFRRNVPLPVVVLAFKTSPYSSEDHVALNVLSEILGGGRSSRLNERLVNSANPSCVFAGAGSEQLQDIGLFQLQAGLLPGRNPDDVERQIVQTVEEVKTDGVTQEELDKVRTQLRIGIIRGRETASAVAGLLAEAEVFGGDASLVNRDVERLESLTPGDVQAVARKYLDLNAVTVVRYIPDPLGQKSRQVEDKAEGMKAAAVVDDGRQVEPRPIEFPEGYPTQPPVNAEAVRVDFNKGQEFEVDGVKVVVMTDRRLPLVNWNLTFRGGSDADPKGKQGLGDFATQMLRRGLKGMTYNQLNQDLESRGITLEVWSGGDHTSIGGSATVDQIDHAIGRARQILAEATFPEDEFRKLKEQATAGLREELATPTSVAARELSEALWGDHPAGRAQTFKTIESITLDDVKAWTDAVLRKQGAFMVFSGDITPDQARELASQLIAVVKDGAPPVADYALQAPSPGRRVILVDNADGKQANIRMAMRAYTLKSDEKFAGSIANQILSAGVESRLNKYVRAEKGLSYGVGGVFRPGRHVGAFNAETDTNPETVGASIEAVWKVLNDMKADLLPADELAEGKSRIVGGMALQMQTIAQQTQRRIDMILNDYPLDYFDVYPQKINSVSAEQVRDVLRKYVDETKAVVVVVGPARQMRQQVTPLGDVEERPMPMKRPGMEPPTEEGLLGALGNLLKRDKPAAPASQPAATQPAR